MALPENSLSKTALITELANIQNRLEKADENENPIERFFNRDELLEQYDWLQAESSSPETTEK